MPLIDNQNQTLQQALKNVLTNASHIDIAVGYFYFSGFQALAEELKDKKVRILVGLEVDPGYISLITQTSKEEDVDLSRWQPHKPTNSRTLLKQNYIDTLVGFVNDSDIFDKDESNAIYDLFIEKIKDGSLEIRKTFRDNHQKFYIVHNKVEVAQNGDFPGTVFMGSSNLTYKGLMGQGELNDSFREKDKFNEYQKIFDDLWSESESIAIVDSKSKDEFLTHLKTKVWKNVLPSPYSIYVRILDELFARENEESILTPHKITDGQYANLEYQMDAIRIVIDKLNKYDGIILADVVGLGKSIIASAVARNLDINTVIIAPPHIIPQWEDYKEQFGIRGSKVFSSGSIGEVYERYKDSSTPVLFILDEAHRYRNEDTNDYKLMHQICRSHPENKIILLTATPFNNDPKDVFALIKLFQTPGETTIRSVDNLSLRYRELIQRYKKLRRDMAGDNIDQEKIDKEAEEIAVEQRRLIEPIVLRRSRLDLKLITRYKEDLQRQNYDFAVIRGPELLGYDLGNLLELYVETLDLITKSENEGFVGARYKPSEYIKQNKREEFLQKIKEDLGEDIDLKVTQSNLAQFMRRLLVMRFESSKEAFHSTLNNMIASNELVENWWDNLDKVPIMKKGQLPDPADYNLEDGEISDELHEEIELLKANKGLLEVNKEWLEPDFIDHVRHDTELLKKIRARWFSDSKFADEDPKFDAIFQKIKEFLKEDPNKKIVIFSSYKDTVDYLFKKLIGSEFTKVIKYTASEPNSARELVKVNFDASIQDNKQVNDYDVLIATDAMSEGVNLHRAGIVINYDIPYNPTRVIQRVGRINRINKKVFDTLVVFNCFPTKIGEAETHIKSISTLKIKLINAVVGSDTRTLTQDEELVSFFKDEFDKLMKESESVSWDTPHREAYDIARKNTDFVEQVNQIPRRSRIKRQENKSNGVVVFGKKGNHSIFTFGTNIEEAEVVSMETALRHFEANENEKAFEVDSNFSGVFNLAKEKLFAKSELPQIRGRRAEAIKILKVISDSLPNAQDYCEDIITIVKSLDDISEGTLKDITQLNLGNIEIAYEKLKELVPIHFIRNVLDRASHNQDEQELLLFAEQLQ